MLNKHLITALAAGAALVAALPMNAAAAGVNGKANLMCSVSNVVGCADGMCMQGGPAAFGLMHYLFVDFQRKVVHGVNDEGKEVTSPVRNMEITEQAIILQGVENQRGWTLGIGRGDGGLRMSSTGPDVNIIIIGDCAER
jgi:hypothetical protein